MSEQPVTLLEVALVRGLNLPKENKRIQSYSPPPNVMYHIILAAVLNLHEAILERLDKQDETLENICQMQQALAGRINSAGAPDQIGAEPFELAADFYDRRELSSAPVSNAAPRLVNKPCLDCKVMMIQVHPATLRCPACKEARK